MRFSRPTVVVSLGQALAAYWLAPLVVGWIIYVVLFLVYIKLRFGYGWTWLAPLGHLFPDILGGNFL